MTRPLLKVCGVTGVGFAAYAAAHGADILGVVFAEGSPRRIDVPQAVEIASAARMANPDVKIAGVFAGESVARAIDAARAVPLDIVQFHADTYTQDDALAVESAGFEAWALASSPAAAADGAGNAARDRAVLFDGRDGKRTGGTGRLADWDAARSLAATGRRVVLAGGISAANIAAAVRTQAAVIDANSAIESAPGVKDEAKFDELAAAFRDATAQTFCIVGSNADATPPQSLHVLRFDRRTGEASIVQSLDGLAGTTYFTFDRERRFLYTCGFDAVADDKHRGWLARMPWDASAGSLGKPERLCDLPCEGPCHVALSPDGRFLSFAAYLSGTAGAFDLKDGALHAFTLPDDAMGPHPSRQKKAYAHCVFYTPDGRFTGVNDLGCDRICFFKTGTFERAPSLDIRFDPGDGPRHSLFSPDGRLLYVVNELSNTVCCFSFDGASFKRLWKVSTLPSGFAGESKTAALKLSPDGKLLAVSNRGHDSIAFFALAGEKPPRLVNIAPLSGRFPRDFAFSPCGRFVVAGHKLSDEVQIYRFEPEGCTLTGAGSPIRCGRPLCFVFAQ